MFEDIPENIKNIKIRKIKLTNIALKLHTWQTMNQLACLVITFRISQKAFVLGDK